jgi:hypothetical protein
MSLPTPASRQTPSVHPQAAIPVAATEARWRNDGWRGRARAVAVDWVGVKGPHDLVQDGDSGFRSGPDINRYRGASSSRNISKV